MNSKIFALALILSIWTLEIECSLNPLITNWVSSTGYGYGAFSGIRADILQIYYTKNKVFINCNSIPSYSIGPWASNPNNATAQNFTVSFALSPSSATTKTATKLGVNGLFTNGVAMFNAWDGNSYNTVWERNAYFIEGVSFG